MLKIHWDRDSSSLTAKRSESAESNRLSRTRATKSPTILNQNSERIFVSKWYPPKLCYVLLIMLLFSGMLCAQGFENVTEEAGLDTVHVGNPLMDEWRWGTGAAWLDYNKDGHLDLYITQRQGANRLYRNLGNGGFVNQAATMGVEDADHDGAGACVADINNDGYPDIYVCNTDQDVLFLNNAGVSFTDIGTSAGLDIMGERRSSSASFADFNEDGYVDLFVAVHEWNPFYNDPLVEEDQQNFLFVNNGNNTFTDVTHLIEDGEPENTMGYSFIGGWTDYDRDEDMDLYVINDCGFSADDEFGDTPMKLFKNLWTETGMVDFEEVGSEVNMDQCQHGMGLGIADYNRDSWMDFAWSNIGPGQLFKSEEGEGFVDAVLETGMGGFLFLEFTWGASFGDLNSDGWQDLVFASGQLEEDDQKYSWNYLFMAQGDTTFLDQKWEYGFGDKIQSRTIAMGDYDNDQDLDVIVVNYGDSLQLLENTWDNNALLVKLIGDPSNKFGIGSKIRVVTEDEVQYLETKSGSNLGAGDALATHIGLGDYETIDTLEIIWPAGTYQLLFDVEANQCIEIIEEEFLLPSALILVGERSGSEVNLSWYGCKVGSSYSLEMSGDGHDFQKLSSWEGNELSMFKHAYTDNAFYRISSRNDIESNVVYLKGMDVSLSYFPNPNKGFLHYSTDSPGWQYQIMNLNGRVIQEGYLYTQSGMIRHELSSGCYLIKSIKAGKELVEKFVVIE